MSTPRQKRSNGIASREAILDAAAEISGERGYEGTSIKLVSERSGLPASSIYWHFKNKDELIAAVIDRSFTEWVGVLTSTVDTRAADGPELTEEEIQSDEFFVESFKQAGKRLAEFPDFLRLGLMLTIEQRPTEPAARKRFVESRTEMLGRLSELYQLRFPTLSEDDITRLARFTLAGSDGLFVAVQVEAIDLGVEFELLGASVLGLAKYLEQVR